MRGLKSVVTGWVVACALVVSVGSQAVWAASVNITIPDPNPKTITCGDDTLGTLTINKYTQDNPARRAGTVGATLEATFAQADPTCDLKLEWIQAVVAGVGTIGQVDTARDNVADPIPYLDPYERDDNLPFYWTAPENGTVGDGKANAGANSGTHFFDAPSQDSRNTGNSIHFETALVAVACDNPKDLYWLAGFTWGYSINGGGASVADAFVWKGAPSAAMTSAVTGFDGTTDFVGDGNDTMANNAGGSPGYKFVAGCPCCCNCVPLPNAASMTLVGLGLVVGLGILKRTRVRMACAA